MAITGQAAFVGPLLRVDAPTADGRVLPSTGALFPQFPVHLDLRERSLTVTNTYRMKTVEVEAMHFKGGAANATPIIEWVLANGGTASWHEAHEGYGPDEDGKGYDARPEAIEIGTGALGHVRVHVGDWVIRASPAGFYTYSHDTFTDTYESVQGTPEVPEGERRVPTIGDSIQLHGWKRP